LNVEQFSATTGGPLSAPGDFELSGRDAAQLFRELRYLRLPLPVSLDYLRFLPAQTVLNAQFKTLQYNALEHASTDLRAVVTNSGGWVRVTLPAPAQLTAITLHSPHGDASHSIAIHRVDGDAIADQASASATVPSIGFEAGGAIGINTSMQAQLTGTAAARQQTSSQSQAQSQAFINPRRYQVVDFTGQEFALQLLDEDGVVVPGFSTNWLAALTITSYPSTPQLALVLAVVDDINAQLVLPPDNSIPLWSEAGELGKGGTPAATLQTLGANLATTLEAGINRLAEQFPLSGTGFIDIALLFSSSAPCKVSLANLNIAYQAIKRGSVNASTEKITLRFERSGGQTLPLQLALPPGIVSGEVNVTIDESIAAGGSAAPATDTALLETLAGPVTGNHSLLLDEGDKAVQPLTLTTATWLRGITLAIATISDSALISIELLADRNGAPAGDSLLHLEQAALTAKHRHWQRFAVTDSLLLASGDYWLAVSVNQGVVYWYLQQESGQSVLRQPGGSAGRQFRGWRALYQLQSGSGASLSSVQSQALVRLVDQKLAAVPTDDGKYRYSFALGSESGPVDTVDLTVTAAGKGLLTVYPPEIVFDFVPV
jgi:hypothetical protein